MPATWGDIIGCIIISTLFFGGIAAFVYVTESAKKAASEKDSELRAKGVTLTSSGVDIKLDRQAPTREDIVDAQQRAFMKGGEALMRPGVVQAGRQASFTEESKPSTPSAFERAGSETEEQRKARFRLPGSRK